MLRARLISIGICLLIITAGGATAKTDPPARPKRSGAADPSAAAYKKAADSYYQLIYSTKKFPRKKWMEAV